MFRKIIFFSLTFVVAISVSLGCMRVPDKKVRKQEITMPAGTLSPTLGIGFDAQYDSALDSVIPGYKIVTVAFKNNTMEAIRINPEMDKWYLQDRRGNKVHAIINLRDKDPDVWGKLPKRVKILIEYPLLIPIGQIITIDLLFNDKENLGEFKAVFYKLGGTKVTYRIVPRVE